MMLLEMLIEPAALKIPPPSARPPSVPLPPLSPDRTAAGSISPRQPRRSHCQVVQNVHPGKRDLSARVQNPCSQCGITVLNGQFDIEILPPSTWKTRSRSLPSMIVALELHL